MRRASGIRAQIALCVYITAIFAASWVTDWRVIAGLLAALLASFFRDTKAVLKRTFLLVAPFVLVTAAATMGYWWWAEGAFDRTEMVSAFALRTILLACMTFIFVRRVDLFEALSFSKTLVTVLTIAMAQIELHRRLIHEFPQVARSRTVAGPGARGTLRAASVLSGSLLGQSITQGKETAEAMRSRGM
ncbi:MAG: hypothetical protein HY897_20715 [Deltaproteobacteria bacterium]|nr:hypothetical protein [Deltaproteobacteria bacterium]